MPVTLKANHRLPLTQSSYDPHFPADKIISLCFIGIAIKMIVKGIITIFNY